MTLLFPYILWLWLPLILLLWKTPLKLKERMYIIVVMLLLLCLARPVQKESLENVAIDAKDIVIALDVSYSMMAKDIAPTRYDFAKQTINALLQANPTDNVMLMAFTTNPLLLSPPTTDHPLISIALEALNPAFILTKGTSLKRLFEAFEKMGQNDKNLILITDGAEEKNVEALAPLLTKAHLSLSLLALGTPQGTTLEKEDGTLLKDKEGNLVISRINPALERLVSLVEGNYIEPRSTPTQTAHALANVLHNNQTKSTLSQKIQYHYLELYPIPLTIALILFLMLHTRGVKYLLLLFALLGIEAQASTLDNYTLSLSYQSYQKNDFQATHKYLKTIKEPSLQSQILLANTHYKQNEFKKAIKIYRSIASTSVSIKQHLYYNIANAYAMQQAYDEAKIYYAKALQLGEDSDSRHNLSLIALLHNQKDASLGIAHPKSQDSSSSSSSSSDKEPTRNEDEPSSGSGSGSEGETTKTKKEKPNKLVDSGSQENHPLSSKVYELINKGYIREKEPW